MKIKSKTILTIVIVLMLIGLVWHICIEVSWAVNNTPVSYLERLEAFLGGPVYFLVPGVISHLVLTIREKNKK